MNSKAVGHNFKAANGKTGPDFFSLRLYVVGQTPKSQAATANLEKICGEYLAGHHQIEVIDLLKNPQLALDHQIVAIPTLVIEQPLPVRKIIGDLSDTDRVLIALGLRELPPRAIRTLANFYEWNYYMRSSDLVPCEAIGFTGSNLDLVQSLPEIAGSNDKLVMKDWEVTIPEGKISPPQILRRGDYLVWDGTALRVWGDQDFKENFQPMKPPSSLQAGTPRNLRVITLPNPQ
jgi:circadian clock protein KaiB